MAHLFNGGSSRVENDPLWADPASCAWSTKSSAAETACFLPGIFGLALQKFRRSLSEHMKSGSTAVENAGFVFLTSSEDGALA